jgi:hypothetical protein
MPDGLRIAAGYQQLYMCIAGEVEDKQMRDVLQMRRWKQQ